MRVMLELPLIIRSWIGAVDYCDNVPVKSSFTLTLLQAKDDNGVMTPGKRPRGRPRKLPAANHRESGVANDVDRGGGGDGDGGFVKGSSTDEEAELLKDILLDNCDDKEEEDDQVGGSSSSRMRNFRFFQVFILLQGPFLCGSHQSG